MDWYYYVIISILAILLLFLLVCYICYKMTFYNNRKKQNDDEVCLPKDEIYTKYKELIISDIANARNMPHQTYQIKSFDGLTLKANYYEYEKNAPIEIMVHGYKGSGERDLSTGIRRAFACHRSAFIIDQRACGKSEGNIITFGVNESKDCLSWIDFVIKTFGDDVKIILTGISMGAATVVNVSSFDLPKNVVGILADCGFHDSKEIISKTIKDMKLPVKLFYPFVKMAAKIFAHFNLEEITPIESIKKCKLPIIFIHGRNKVNQAL